VPQLKHPISGALYSLEANGLVKVDNNGVVGYFTADGQYHSGEIRQADPHLAQWLAGPKLPDAAGTRRHRG
jgi:hypothetical protein